MLICFFNYTLLALPNSRETFGAVWAILPRRGGTLFLKGAQRYEFLFKLRRFHAKGAKNTKRQRNNSKNAAENSRKLVLFSLYSLRPLCEI